MTTPSPSESSNDWRELLQPVLKQHWRWYERGRTGEGRITLSDRNLQGASVRGLQGARFERCDLSGATVQLWDDVELVGCSLDAAGMNVSTWRHASIANCSFRHAHLGLAQFVDAAIDGGDWGHAYLERAGWTRSSVRNVDFRGAAFVDGRLDDATFVGCDLRGADLSRKDLDLDLARCRGTRFENCDFRGANFAGLRLSNVSFDRCRLHGVMGTPVLEQPCTFIAPDLSAAGDGSDVREAADILQAWQGRS